MNSSDYINSVNLCNRFRKTEDLDEKIIDHKDLFYILLEIIYRLPDSLLEYSRAMRRTMDSEIHSELELRGMYDGIQIFDEIQTENYKENNNNEQL